MTKAKYTSFEKNWKKKSKLLTHGLLISGALNIGLVSTFCYFAFSKNHRVRLEKSQKEFSISETNADVIKSFFSYSFDELVYELHNKKLLEDGYRKQDLALAYLVDYHYLNLDQALSGISYQKRFMTFLHHEGGEKFELMVYPGLNQEHFDRILSYIQKEKWPFSAEGLYYEIGRRKDYIPDELKDAFYLTPYFHTVYMLLSREDPAISREEVLAMLIEGDWEQLEIFVNNQRQYPDLGEEQRRALLHQYVKKSSQIASHLIVRLDTEYALKKMDDQDMLRLIHQIDKKTMKVIHFLKQLLISPRSDEVRLTAANKLYQLDGLDYNEVSYEKALIDYLPAVISKKSNSVEHQGPMPSAHSELTQVRIHIVKEGDSLWKIAKQYQVSMSDIMKCNQLKKKSLLPIGKKLKIPKK